MMVKVGRSEILSGSFRVKINAKISGYVTDPL